MRILAGLGVVAVLFAAGFLTGRWWQEQSGAVAEQRVALPPAPQGSVPQDLTIDRAARAHREFGAALAGRDWSRLVTLLEEARSSGQSTQYEALYEGMRAVAQDLVAAEAAAEAAALLSTYSELNPQDYDVRFQLADAWLAAGEPGLALEPILEVLAAPLTVEVAERAAQVRDQLAGIERSRLEAAGDLAGLVALQERLLAAEPGSEEQRLALAAAQLEAGALDAAEETLELVSGYDPSAVADLEEQLAAQRSQLTIERSGREMFAVAAARDEPLRLLIDTGATQSALDTAALTRIAAEVTGELRSVLTAAGPIEAAVYRVPELRLAGRRFTDVEVLELPASPTDADGLLGLDLLAQLGEVGLLAPR